MVRCTRIEIWKAFHNKMFWGSILVGLFLSMINIIHNIVVVSEFTQILFQMIDANIAVSKSYEGFSLFTCWIAVNSSSLGSNLFNILWPILAAMPFAWSYSAERRSGYYYQIVSRTKTEHYFLGKYIATFISGGTAVMLPVLTDLLVNALICPVCLPDVTTSILPIFNNSFLSELFYTIPWVYAFLWCAMKFFWGGVAASICWIVGAKCRFQTIVLLTPFGLFMFLDVLSDLFCNITSQKQGFSPMVLSQTATGASAPGWAIFGVLTLMLIVTIILGYRQAVKHELE